MISVNPDTAAAAAMPVGAGEVAAARSPLRALLLLAGAVGAGLLSAWVWMLGRENGRFVLVEREWVHATLPSALVVGAAAGLGLGLMGLLWALLRDQRLRGAIGWCVHWAKRHPKLAALLVVVFCFGAVDVYELFVDAEARRYDRTKGIGLRKFMIREDAKVWLTFAATLMTALAISAMRPWCPKCVKRVRGMRSSMAGRASGKRWLIAAFLVPAVLGSAMSLLALDGVPHFSDSLTYQMQGRMLFAGQMAMPAPKHPDLFIGSLFFVTDGQHFDQAKGHIVHEGTRFFGKYPIGWPAILGLFDKVGVGFMANALLTGMGALITFGLARQVTSRRVAVLSAVLFGLSPWVWFNGSHFASHVASMAAVNGFLFFFLRVVTAKPQALSVGRAEAQASYGSAIGGGLCLGAALLVRPFDATMFALPAVLASLILLAREPKRWITHGALITLATGVGIGIYFWSNAMTTGKATVSPYTLEGRWAADWDTGIASIIHRFQFQWAELNGRFPGFGIGGMTVAVLGLIVAVQSGRLRGWFRTPRAVGFAVLLASNALFFVGNTPFLFTNVWWGPRWLFPVAPLLAILAAEVVMVMLVHAGRARGQGPGAMGNEPSTKLSPNPSGAGTSPYSLAQLGFMILIAGLCVGMTVEYGGKWHQHRLAPPHNVSAAADKRAVEMGLTNAIIGIPLGEELKAAGAVQRAPLDPRAGMVFMKAPFESNPVIYVRKVENWAAKAKECYPNRQLYELIADKEGVGGFVIRSYER